MSMMSMKATLTDTNMPRFKWNDQKNGRLLNKYIDYICDEFPTIAKDIVKHGIGDLGYWFEGPSGSANVQNATCGCLVGTSCLVALKKYPKKAKGVEAYKKDSSDAALILYEFIVAQTKRDVSKYDSVEWSSHHKEVDNPDPLLVLIQTAGERAAEEAEPTGEMASLDNSWEVRDRQVRDHFENRIRRNLNIPYPKQKTQHAQA